jgi:glycosyltransferase involved in cell wall biosynthesis
VEAVVTLAVQVAQVEQVAHSEAVAVAEVAVLQLVAQAALVGEASVEFTHIDIMNFSVAIIVKQEATTLPRMLKSLEEFKSRGGEVCICDTGSTDDTVKIAKDWGCRVAEVGDKFLKKISKKDAKAINEMFVVDGEEPIVKGGDTYFNYSAARNYAADMCSNDVVAMPDADEAYTKLDLDAVEAVIKSGVEQLQYNFVFSHDAFGNEAIKFMHCKFYDRRKLRWRGVIHEILAGEAKAQFLHEGIIKLEHFQNPNSDRSHYLKGLAIDCWQQPDYDRNSHYLGREMYWRGRYKSAIKELTRHVAMNKWQTERSQSMLFIGDSWMMLGEDAKGLVAYNEAFAIDSTRREPFMRLADYYYRKKDYQRTAAYCEAAITIPANRFYSNHQELYTYKPHELAYFAY